MSVLSIIVMLADENDDNYDDVDDVDDYDGGKPCSHEMVTESITSEFVTENKNQLGRNNRIDLECLKENQIRLL